MLDFVLENNAKDNFLIEQIKVIFKYPRHCFSVCVKDIINIDSHKIVKSDIINNMPFSVEPYTTIRKKVSFELSDTCIEKIKEYFLNGNELVVGLEVSDTKKRKIYSEMKKCIVKFSE